MISTPNPGSEPSLAHAASYGGPGWRGRPMSHLEELKAGLVWGRFGQSSEVAPLRDVMLAWPGLEQLQDADPDSRLMLGKLDLAALQAETQALAALYLAHGVQVHFLKPPRLPPPNLLFLRDLFVMTPEGAVLSRMAAEQRRGEEPFASRALADLEIPLLATVRGNGVLEGADALWVSPEHVLVGLGRRTNPEGFAQLEAVLQAQGVTAHPVQLPSEIQHLLGVVNFLAPDFAAVFTPRATPSIREALAHFRIRTLELPLTTEMVHRKAMNFVTLSPMEVVMPAGCPGVKARLEAEGVRCHEAVVDQYLLGAGGPGCVTGILRRSW